MAIDHAVSRAIFLAHALERAVHDPGPWMMTLDDWAAQAHRQVTDTGVHFHATFPPLWSAPEQLSLTLTCGGETVLSRNVDAPIQDDAVVLHWELGLDLLEVRA